MDSEKHSGLYWLDGEDCGGEEKWIRGIMKTTLTIIITGNKESRPLFTENSVSWYIVLYFSILW